MSQADALLPATTALGDQQSLITSCLAQGGHALGGLLITGPHSPDRQRYLGYLSDHFQQQGRAVVHIPAGVDIDRLLGGLNLAATLRHGTPIREKGLLEKADGGLLILHMAERQEAYVHAILAETLDRGGYALEREGVSAFIQTQFTLLVLDEAEDGEDRIPSRLRDRLAFALPSIGLTGSGSTEAQPDEVDLGKRGDLPLLSENHMADLTAMALELGVWSFRAVLQAARVVRLLAAGAEPQAHHIATAVHLVLIPRATAFPTPPEPEQETQDQPPPEPDATDMKAAEAEGVMADQILESVLAQLPSTLWDGLRSKARNRKAGLGRRAKPRAPAKRGRPLSPHAGILKSGARLDILATLRAAAPWQRLRQAANDGKANKALLRILPEDFRIKRYKSVDRTATLFLVDASGSAAVHRLAEVKGAVELMLADCYVRRDEVGLVAFRGEGADILLEPTRSLARTRACLSQLPGGGATPLAAGLDAIRSLADSVHRRGLRPFIVILTEGGANRARSGETGRAIAQEDAEKAAGALAQEGLDGVVIDCAPRPKRDVKALADQCGFDYVALPRVDAHSMADAIKHTARGAG